MKVIQQKVHTKESVIKKSIFNMNKCFTSSKIKVWQIPLQKYEKNSYLLDLQIFTSTKTHRSLESRKSAADQNLQTLI